MGKISAPGTLLTESLSDYAKSNHHVIVTVNTHPFARWQLTGRVTPFSMYSNHLQCHITHTKYKFVCPPTSSRRVSGMVTGGYKFKPFLPLPLLLKIVKSGTHADLHLQKYRKLCTMYVLMGKYCQKFQTCMEEITPPPPENSNNSPINCNPHLDS